MTTEELIGKYYQLLDIDNSVLASFKIGHVRIEIRPSIEHSDGSTSPSYVSVLVSDNGTGWFKIYGGSTDRILTEAEYQAYQEKIK